MNYRLKRCKVESLEAGMILGNTVYDENHNVLIDEGAVLNNQMIFKLLDRWLEDVDILEALPQEENVFPSGPKAIRDQNVLDLGYVGRYRETILKLKDIFSMAQNSGQVNVEAVENIVTDPGFMQMVDGAKAITQVHNIPRSEDYLLHHSLHVAVLLGVMGKWLEFKPRVLQDIVTMGLLYEIGKTQIDREILEKPGKLTEDEMKKVQQHASLAFELLRYTKLKDRQDVLFGILQHHERLDGSGYPARMSGKQICSFAKLLAIADIYDAMGAKKAYAMPTSPFFVFNFLMDQIATNKIDPEYGVLFIKNMRQVLNGNWVYLSNGTKAKIIYVDEKDLRAEPVVQSEAGKFIDLNKAQDIMISYLLTEDQIS